MGQMLKEEGEKPAGHDFFWLESCKTSIVNHKKKYNGRQKQKLERPV